MAARLTIRRCRSTECALVLGVWKEAGSMTSVTDTVEVLARLLQLENTALFIAEHKDRLVGTVIAGWDGWRGNLYRLAVIPAYRRQGLARLLVNEAESFLAAQGAQRIGGLVAREGPSAVSFWDAMADAGYARDESFVRYAKSRNNS